MKYYIGKRKTSIFIGLKSVEEICKIYKRLTLSREALGPIGPSVFKGKQLKA